MDEKKRIKVKFLKDCACGIIQYSKDSEAMLLEKIAKTVIKAKFAIEIKSNKEN